MYVCSTLEMHVVLNVRMFYFFSIVRMPATWSTPTRLEHGSAFFSSIIYSTRNHIRVNDAWHEIPMLTQLKSVAACKTAT